MITNTNETMLIKLTQNFTELNLVSMEIKKIITLLREYNFKTMRMDDIYKKNY